MEMENVKLMYKTIVFDVKLCFVINWPFQLVVAFGKAQM